jgi:predicted O-methyltransferase YrrM
VRDRQTPLTPELLDYIEETFTAEDSFLSDVVDASWYMEGIPQINITGWQGNFLQFLVKSINAKNILEIGTLAGYSAITMARAAGDNAHILTIEKERLHYKYALERIAQAGLSDKIEVVNANAREWVKNYKPLQPLDMIFLDADKSGYWQYVQRLTPHLRSGGLLIMDNAFAFGFLLDTAPERSPELAKSMLGFHKKLLGMAEYFTTIVPIGDGMLLSRKT